MRQLQAYRDLFSNAMHGKLLIAFEGHFSSSAISNIAESVRHLVCTIGGKALARKAFGIFVELAQNISRYSADRNAGHEGKGQFLFFLKNDSFYFISSNLIDPVQMDFLKRKISEVNRQSPEELKASYIVRQRQKNDRANQSAGLGLLYIVRRSGHPLGSGFLPEGEGKLRFFLRIMLK